MSDVYEKSLNLYYLHNRKEKEIKFLSLFYYLYFLFFNHTIPITRTPQ